LNQAVFRGDNFFVRGQQVRWSAPYRFEEFKISPEAEDALLRIKSWGWLTIVVTNQPDIAYGLLPIEDHDRCMALVRALPVDDVLVCLHTRDQGCACKKPKPGMLLQAASKWAIDLSQSYMIGDTESDAGAARAAGCAGTILLDREYNQGIAATYRVFNLSEAADLIAKL